MGKHRLNDPTSEDGVIQPFLVFPSDKSCYLDTVGHESAFNIL